jgi:hypothetical protein
LWYKFPHPFASYFHCVHASSQLLTAYFPVTSLRLGLISDVCIAVVYMTWVGTQFPEV